MKILNQPTQLSKKVIISSVGILLVIGVYFIVAKNVNIWPFMTTESAPNTIYTSPPANTKEDQIISNKNSVSDQEVIKTTDEIPASSDAVAKIIRLEQKEDLVFVSAVISNVASTGRCVVSFTNPNDKPVTREFDATTKDKTASCGPFSVPTTDFSYLGAWHVTIRYYEGDKQTVVEGDVNIS